MTDTHEQPAAATEVQAYIDLGWQAANAVRSQALLDGTLPAADAHAITAQEIVSLTLLAVAHLANNLGLTTDALFEQALDDFQEQQHAVAQQPLPGCQSPAGPQLAWIKIPQPSLASERHAAKVLHLLKEAGATGVTTTDLRHLGVKNPSSVVLRLIRQGHPIQRSNEHHPNQHGGHTRYVLKRT